MFWYLISGRNSNTGPEDHETGPCVSHLSPPPRASKIHNKRVENLGPLNSIVDRRSLKLFLLPSFSPLWDFLLFSFLFEGCLTPATGAHKFAEIFFPHFIASQGKGNLKKMEEELKLLPKKKRRRRRRSVMEHCGFPPPSSSLFNGFSFVRIC